MFDTNIFNRIIDYEIKVADFPQSANLYVTHIQRDELMATRNEERRKELLECFAETSSSSVPTESMVFDVSRWDQCKWSSADGKFQQMFDSLNRLNSNKVNNLRDILIGETALRNGFVLVSDDADLARVVREFQGKTMVLTEFLSLPAQSIERGV